MQCGKLNHCCERPLTRPTGHALRSECLCMLVGRCGVGLYSAAQAHNYFRIVFDVHLLVQYEAG